MVYGQSRPAWGADKEERALLLAKEGLSGVQIAERLGMSRSAVIGKLSRMGYRIGDVNGRNVTTRNKKRAKHSRYQSIVPSGVRTPPVHREPTPELVQLSVSKTDGVLLVDLQDEHCRWPHGEREDTWYCGRQREENSSYCAGHGEHSRRRIGE